jgi:hypothetical protein
MRFILAAVAAAAALSLKSTAEVVGIFDPGTHPSRAEYGDGSLKQHLRTVHKMEPDGIQMSHIEKASLMSLESDRRDWR